MPSGAVVTLQKVTYGTKHRFVYGSIWQKLTSWLPWGIGRSSARVATCQTTNDSVVAWLVWKGKPETLMRKVPTYVVVNDRGETVSIIGSAVIQIGTDLLIDGRKLVLPRQSRNVRLRLCELDADSKSVCIGEFQLPVPSRKNAPSWRPEPLPIRRMEGGVEFALTRFTAETEVRSERGFASALNTLTFQITERGQHTTNWQLRTIDASDALGNRNVYGVYSYPSRNGDESWTGTWLLWPDEPAKLRLEFARRGAFASNELWRVQGIPVPGSPFPFGTFQSNLQGVTLWVRGISDARGRLPDGTMSENATSNVLHLVWTPSPGVTVSLLELKDDHGHKVNVNGSMGGDHGPLSYQLNISNHIRSVDALFAVRRSRVVEFLAKPELVATNEGRSAVERSKTRDRLK